MLDRLRKANCMEISSNRSQNMLKLTCDDQKAYLSSSCSRRIDLPFQLRRRRNDRVKSDESFHEIFRNQRHLVSIRFSEFPYDRLSF